MQKEYLDYEGLAELVAKIKENYARIEALIFKGTVANIAALPTIGDQKPGYMYNVTEGGKTTADFEIGAGKDLRDGDNVVAINVGTDESPVMKWDILGATFIIEDRLQFGDTMPSTPTNGQTFLYMGDTSYTYTKDTGLTPDTDPSSSGLYEYDSVNDAYDTTSDTYVAKDHYYNVVGDSSTQPTADPAAEGYYESTATGYIKTTDTTVDGSKTYYLLTVTPATVTKGDNPKVLGLYVENSGSYSLTNDTHVVSGTDYYTRAEEYVTGVIYKYDLANTKWDPQTAGDTYIPITNAQIDALFD